MLSQQWANGVENIINASKLVRGSLLIGTAFGNADLG
jgi:hypothetical protein